MLRRTLPCLCTASSHSLTPSSPQAIRHAVTVWNVDIITMSFGYEEESAGCDLIRRAIREAHAEGILMFAAASNAGGHGNRPAFPARVSNIFSIYSGDGMGNCAPTNPNAVTHEYNFLTLGEGVESWWPTALARDPPHTKRLSGTSFATPIAAGIASFLLLYAAQNLPQGDADMFREHDKMREWLYHMSHERGGYNVISIAGFFNRSVDERRFILSNLLQGRSWK